MFSDFLREGTHRSWFLILIPIRFRIPQKPPATFAPLRGQLLRGPAKRIGCVLRTLLLGLFLINAQIVDRVAAIVNDEVITLSDLEWAIGYKRLPIPEDLIARDALLQETLNQLVEQNLIATEASATPGLDVSLPEIERRIEAYKDQFTSVADFERHLTQLGMLDNDLHDLVRRQLTVLLFVKLRFEPFVVILPDQIEAFYRTRFLPQLGVPEEVAPPLSLVEEQIRQILQVEMTTQDLDQWMVNARRRARIKQLLF